MISDYSIKDKEVLKEVSKNCSEIITNVFRNEENNLEINLMMKNHMIAGKEQELGATIIKVVEAKDNTAAYIYCDVDTKKDILLFASGEKRIAYLAVRKKEDIMDIVELSEIYLLSLSSSSKPGKEIGLVSTFTKMNGRVFSSVIIGENLLPIKNLILVDAIRSEQKQYEEIEVQNER